MKREDSYEHIDEHTGLQQPILSSSNEHTKPQNILSSLTLPASGSVPAPLSGTQSTSSSRSESPVEKEKASFAQKKRELAIRWARRENYNDAFQALITEHDAKTQQQFEIQKAKLMCGILIEEYILLFQELLTKENYSAKTQPLDPQQGGIITEQDLMPYRAIVNELAEKFPHFKTSLDLILFSFQEKINLTGFVYKGQIYGEISKAKIQNNDKNETKTKKCTNIRTVQENFLQQQKQGLQEKCQEFLRKLMTELEENRASLLTDNETYRRQLKKRIEEIQEQSEALNDGAEEGVSSPIRDKVAVLSQALQQTPALKSLLLDRTRTHSITKRLATTLITTELKLEAVESEQCTLADYATKNRCIKNLDSILYEAAHRYQLAQEHRVPKPIDSPSKDRNPLSSQMRAAGEESLPLTRTPSPSQSGMDHCEHKEGKEDKLCTIKVEKESENKNNKLESKITELAISSSMLITPSSSPKVIALPHTLTPTAPKLFSSPELELDAIALFTESVIYKKKVHKQLTLSLKYTQQAIRKILQAMQPNQDTPAVAVCYQQLQSCLNHWDEQIANLSREVREPLPLSALVQDLEENKMYINQNYQYSWFNCLNTRHKRQFTAQLDHLITQLKSLQRVNLLEHHTLLEETWAQQLYPKNWNFRLSQLQGHINTFNTNGNNELQCKIMEAISKEKMTLLVDYIAALKTQAKAHAPYNAEAQAEYLNAHVWHENAQGHTAVWVAYRSRQEANEKLAQWLEYAILRLEKLFIPILTYLDEKLSEFENSEKFELFARRRETILRLKEKLVTMLYSSQTREQFFQYFIKEINHLMNGEGVYKQERHTLNFHRFWRRHSTTWEKFNQSFSPFLDKQAGHNSDFFRMTKERERGCSSNNRSPLQPFSPSKNR